MACDLTRDVLHGYLDGELDAVRAAEFERHLESCSQCVAELERQEAVQSALHRSDLYERAPDALRRKVLAQVAPSHPGQKGWTLWRWAALAACLVLLTIGGWRLFSWSTARDQQATIAAELIDIHVRSLQPGHLDDVVSTDQHTVKPWFDGKLDFSPPVHDFAQQGFPLQGGRLEILNGRSIAALVYGRRKHIINVFVWPRAADSGTHSGSRLGYNWVQWTEGNFAMCAVSDTGTADLQELRRLFEEEK